MHSDTVDFLTRLHRPGDRIALVVIARPSGAVRQRLVLVADLTSHRWQAWLHHLNARERCDLYVSVNPLRADARGRTKADIGDARHVFLDVDRDGNTVLERVRATHAVPAPMIVTRSSPGRFQALWRIAGATANEVETIQRTLATQFGGDMAATDITRVCRLPGLLNWKHAPPFPVTATFGESTAWLATQFPHATRTGAASRPPRDGATTHVVDRPRRSACSQSERDWQATRIALARGVDPEDLVQALARSRPDKRGADAYARRTVARAALAARSVPRVALPQR